MRKLRLVSFAALLAGLSTAAASFASAQKTTAAPLVVAVEGPQSGDQASNGLDQLRGVRLAVAQLNGAGGLWDGRKVVVYAADDKGDKRDAKGVAREVIARGIGFVIGPYNSSVGLANLPPYRRSHVLPLWMTSRDETAGGGATVQPMNSQIAPVEEHYVKALGVKRVTLLVDDSANGAFTKGVATSLRKQLMQDGTSVGWISLEEGASPAYYATKVEKALATKADLIYVSTYFPEGLKVAKALTAAGSGPRCLMGLANVDNGFLAGATTTQARRCVFSGVPAAPQMASAAGYVQRYRSAFHRAPGVWGSFTYDSARILFAAINRAKSYGFFAVERALRQTRAFRGATGTITIDPKTGYRTSVPVSILRVGAGKKFVIAR